MNVSEINHDVGQILNMFKWTCFFERYIYINAVSSIILHYSDNITDEEVNCNYTLKRVDTPTGLINPLSTGWNVSS